MSEASEQARIMLHLGKDPRVRIFRNNVGVARFPDGSVVRYGLCPGSADLIGWRTLTIGPEHVGQQIAQFVSIECKAPKGRTGEHQDAWYFAVKRAGGVAIVARAVDDVRGLTD